MADPTPDIDWYPSALRPKDAQPYTPFDRYQVTTARCDVAPDPHERDAALRAIGGAVYACRVAGGLIKIGYSEHLDSRRRGLHGDLLAFMPGTSYADEQAVHERLAPHRHHGREWYYPTPGVLAVVNEMREAIGLDPIAD